MEVALQAAIDFWNTQIERFYLNKTSIIVDGEQALIARGIIESLRLSLEEVKENGSASV